MVPTTGSRWRGLKLLQRAKAVLDGRLPAPTGHFQVIVCLHIHNSGETLRKRPSFRAISAVTARRRLQMRLMVIGVAPTALVSHAITPRVPGAS